MGARDIFNKIKATKAARATVALATFVSGGGRTVPDDVYEERMATCTACKYFQPGDHPTCGDCGCFLKVKCQFPAEACPKGYWREHRLLTKTEMEFCCPGGSQ
jgi:hypothetical protein